VEEEEDEGKGAGEESGFGEETQVYGPFVEEGAGEVEGLGDVGDGVSAEGVAEENLIQLV